jgi:hypothetical protein
VTGYRYPRYYRRRQVSPGTLLAAGAAGVVLLGAVSGAHAHPGHAAPAAMASAPAVTDAIPAASSYTPAAWSRAFLLAAGYAATTCNMAFLLAWINAEGSQWKWRNPLDDELPEPGSYRVNTTGPGQGVQAYASWPSDLGATRLTLTGPDYRPIRSALAAGNDAQRAADAVARSPWGTEPFEASC